MQIGSINQDAQSVLDEMARALAADAKPSHDAEIGKKRWVIAEGDIPPEDTEIKDPTLRGHETACILNVGDSDAEVALTVFFLDREQAGPYRVIVPARRTVHWRLDLLREPEPIPRIC